MGPFKLSAILPTKGRGEQAVRCINRFYETTADFDTELFIIAHPEPETVEAFKKLPTDWPITVNKNLFVEYLDIKPLAAYNYAVQRATGTHFFDFDDDAWFSDGWLYEVKRVFDEHPQAYVKIRGDNSDYWAERAIGNRQVYIDVMGGVISIPHYHSQYNDREKSDRAISAGVFYESNAYIEHRTWTNGKAALDKTYEEGGRMYAAVDHQTYLSRQAAGFPNDYNGVIPLEPPIMERYSV